MLKVSVIVPVYNPGQDIDDCIRSLLDQSLSSQRYEVIFVDDGSTDDTPARLDELAARDARVRTEHIPNSGWPGRPRNLGLDLARGEYVYFVDNDDWLGREALERLCARADGDRADIVIGKVVGHGKRVPHALFRRNRSDVGVEWGPLLGLLTPHKLFRKALLDQHGIRFPEGRRRLEDHMFVVHAYFHAERISVLADYPCYHWVLRADVPNASYRPFDPAGYYQNVREVLDLVEAHTDPGPLRDRMSAHWYRGKMLGRVGGRPFLERDDDYRRALYEEIRRLALERYGPEVEAHLPLSLRVRSRLLRSGRYEALQTLAAAESALRAKVEVRSIRREGATQLLNVEGELVSSDGPLSLVQREGRVLWVPPDGLRDELAEQDLDLTDELARSRLEVYLRSAADRSEYVLPAKLEPRVVPTDSGADAVRIVVAARARLDPRTAASGSGLPPGTWYVLGTVVVVGFSATARLPEPGSDGARLLTIDTTRRSTLARRSLLRRIMRKVPWLRRLVGTARRALARIRRRGG